MGDYVPVAEGSYSFTTTAAVTGGQLVEMTGDATVGPAQVTSQQVAGVAAFDAASGAKVDVFPIDKVHETIAGTGGLTAGNPVKAGALGTVVEYTVGTDPVPSFLGICTVGATATNLARWRGY
ncbi:MAG TPA: hypothetical protein VG435_10640 [Acidimicrobiales bacterium]|jgi:hypothetical protein|nr:hypothetical protein [Acidimicrobiales bacterium]